MSNIKVVSLAESKGDVFQLFESSSSTFTYFLVDRATQEAAVIDPVYETVERDYKLIQEMGLQVKYILDTHVHADHITGASELKKLTGAKTVISKNSGVNCVDLFLQDGDQLKIGQSTIYAIATPGHTNGCMSYYFEGNVFTGDTLLIQGCGRTDFQQGSVETLYESITKKLFSLPDETILYPGHDYRGLTRSTIKLEKRWNPRIRPNVTLEQFKKTMSELKLSYPKKIDVALPANMTCGAKKQKRFLNPQNTGGIPEVTVHDVFENRKHIALIDVRRSEEFNNEYGHIEGARLVTLGPDLIKFLESSNREEEMVFICRSGGRSSQATDIALQMGFTNVANMAGGMIAWNLHQLPVERS